MDFFNIHTADSMASVMFKALFGIKLVKIQNITIGFP